MVQCCKNSLTLDGVQHLNSCIILELKNTRHKVFTGDRPSNSLLLPICDPHLSWKGSGEKLPVTDVDLVAIDGLFNVIWLDLFVGSLRGWDDSIIATVVQRFPTFLTSFLQETSSDKYFRLLSTQIGEVQPGAAVGSLWASYCSTGMGRALRDIHWFYVQKKTKNKPMDNCFMFFCFLCSPSSPSSTWSQTLDPRFGTWTALISGAWSLGRSWVWRFESISPKHGQAECHLAVLILQGLLVAFHIDDIDMY